MSLFAAFLALHNMATRYLFALGRARLLPSVLGRTSRRGAPYVASATQVAFNAIVVGIFAIGGADPAARHHREHDRFRHARDRRPAVRRGGVRRRVLPPSDDRASGAPSSRRGSPPALLATVFILAVVNFNTLAGSEADVIGLLPWLILIVLLVGVAVAEWLRRNRPERYAALGTEGEEALG